MNKNTTAEIIYGDSFKQVDLLNRKFNLVVTSPPYNIGKAYEKKEPLDTYLDKYKELSYKLYDLIEDNGSLCWQVGTFVHNNEVFPLDIFFYDIFKTAGFKLRNRIIWHFESGLHSTKRLSGRYETILWFTKKDTYKFNLDDIRVKQKYPNKRHYRGKKKGELSCNPIGKNPSDFWDNKIVEKVAKDWEAEIWSFTNIKANHREKTNHPCQFPTQLVERLILALTDKNDCVLDPFVGVGSTNLACYKNQRNSIGIEIDKNYFKIGNERIKKLQEGEIITQPIIENNNYSRKKKEKSLTKNFKNEF